MTTRTPTRRTIEVPGLVGDKAEQAIQRLRELGLMPTSWCAEVEDVNEAGFVLGFDPPAGSPVRPTASITISVAAQPEIQERAAGSLARQADKLVQTPLTGLGICDDFAVSPAGCRDASAHPQDGHPTRHSWR